MRCSVFIATSLDGYIAREDGTIDWLLEANGTVPAGEDCGFAEFMSGIDVLVMGRNTFEQVMTFDTWPYGETRLVVLSSSLHRVPDGCPDTVSVANATPRGLIRDLADAGCTHAYIDGGDTIRRFLADGLIDHITITVIPVLLGGGKPLFGAAEKDVWLELESSRSYDFGFVQNRYRVRRG